LQTVGYKVAAEFDHVRTPVVGMFIEVSQQFRLPPSKVKEEVFALSHNQLIIGMGFVARVDEQRGIQQVAAVITLVAARVRVVADVTLAFDVAIWQKTFFLLAVQQLLLFLIQVATLQQQQEKILSDFVVIFGVGVGEQIEADTDFLQGQQKAVVIMLENLPRRDATLVGLYRDRRTVTVRTGDHQHLISGESVVTGENVGWQVCPRQVADV
jgi:hypothetical protein